VNAKPGRAQRSPGRHAMLFCGQKVPQPAKPSQAFETHRLSVRRIVEAHQARNPLVFGSIARGEDTASRHLDLLVDTTESTSLLDLAAIELGLERLIGIPVHVTTAGALHGTLRERVLAKAEPV